MRFFASILFIIIIYSSSLAQETFKYIDHDARNNSLLDFLATDSLIYFAQDSDSSGAGLSFGSIDSSGTISRTKLSAGGHPGKTRILNKGDDHFDILYYNFIDYDISGPGLTEVKYRNGNVSHRWRLQDYGMIRYAHLNYAGDSLFTLRYNYNPQESIASLFIFNDDDELILQKEIPDEIEVLKFEGIGTDLILLQTEQSLYRLTPDNETALFFDSSSPIREIINEETECYIINGNEVWEYNLGTQELTLLFNHNIDFENVKFIEDHFVFHTKNSDLNVLNRYSLEGMFLDTLTTINGELEDFTIIDTSIVYPGTFNYGIDNNNYFITSWTKKSISTSLAESCVDIEISNVEIFNSANEILFTETNSGGEEFDHIQRSYEYTIEVQNVGNTDIDSFHIYSSPFFIVFLGNDNIYPFLSDVAYDIEIGETKEITGTFDFSFYDHQLSRLNVYIPGADHLLDCYPEDNNFTATDILSSTVDKSPKTDLRLYPNPVKDMLFLETIKLNQPYSIYDIHGQLLKRGIYQNGISIESFINGNYILESQGQRTRFIVQH